MGGAKGAFALPPGTDPMRVQTLPGKVVLYCHDPVPPFSCLLNFLSISPPPPFLLHVLDLVLWGDRLSGAALEFVRTDGHGLHFASSSGLPQTA